MTRDVRRTPVPPTPADELSARADSAWVRDMSLTRRRFRMAVLRALLDIQQLLKERP